MPNTRVLRASSVEGGILTEFTPSDLGWSAREIAPIANYDSSVVDLTGLRYLKFFLQISAVNTPAAPNAATALQISSTSYDGTVTLLPLTNLLASLATPAANLVYVVSLSPGGGIAINGTIVANSFAFVGLGRTTVRLSVVTSTLGTSVTSNLWIHGHS